MSIFIGNLPYEVGKEDLENAFADYGTVKSVRIPVDRETGNLRGFAFVELSSDSEEDEAIAALDQAEWLGRQLRVSKAKPRPENDRRRRNNNE